LPDGKTPISDTLGALAELVVEGKVREIGCSNFDHAKLEEAESAVADGSPGFACVQNRYSLLHREPEEGVLQYCDRTKTAFLPYYPLASGVLTGKYRSGEVAPEGSRMAAWTERAKTELTDERLATVTDLGVLARNAGHTVLDLAFGWLLSHASVASVIAGATKPAQVVSNVAASHWKPDAELLAQADRISLR
jgi:aryl-alcohol dehydrogenase-like predicted oxidoreductase